MDYIKFNYLYRDGSNYKNWGEIIFSDPDNCSIQSLSQSFRAAFEGDLFIAHQVGIPEIFDFPDGILTSDDHCFHEFDSIEVTTEATNDLHERTIDEFLTEVSTAARSGWRAFDRTVARHP